MGSSFNGKLFVFCSVVSIERSQRPGTAETWHHIHNNVSKMAEEDGSVAACRELDLSREMWAGARWQEAMHL